MDWNKDLQGMEQDTLLDALEAAEELVYARSRARRYGLDELDEIALGARVADIYAELDRRDTEEQACALAEYYKAVIAV